MHFLFREKFKKILLKNQISGYNIPFLKNHLINYIYYSICFIESPEIYLGLVMHGDVKNSGTQEKRVRQNDSVLPHPYCSFSDVN